MACLGLAGVFGSKHASWSFLAPCFSWSSLCRAKARPCPSLLTWCIIAVAMCRYWPRGWFPCVLADAPTISRGKGEVRGGRFFRLTSLFSVMSTYVLSSVLTKPHPFSRSRPSLYMTTDDSTLRGRHLRGGTAHFTNTGATNYCTCVDHYSGPGHK